MRSTTRRLTVGLKAFPKAISFKALSNIAWASSFFSLQFSSSRDRSRFASDTYIPPWRLRQLYSVVSLILAGGANPQASPPHCNFRISMIYTANSRRVDHRLTRCCMSMIASKMCAASAIKSQWRIGAGHGNIGARVNMMGAVSLPLL